MYFNEIHIIKYNFCYLIKAWSTGIIGSGSGWSGIFCQLWLTGQLIPLSFLCRDISLVWKKILPRFDHLGAINNIFLVFEAIFAEWRTNTHQSTKVAFLMISQLVMAKLLIAIWLKKCDEKFCPRLLLNILRALD